MKSKISLKGLMFLLFAAALSSYFAACGDNSTTSYMSDNDYLQSVISGGNSQSESNVTSTESDNLNNGIAVPDDDNGMLSPIDSLKRWGRVVTGVNVNYNVTDFGDTVKSVLVTRTITGYYVIRAYAGGLPDSVNKPYTEVFTRTVSFKRINSKPDPRLNWALYQVSMANGKTTTPQVGTAQITINSINVYDANNNLLYTFNGPDFTQNIFTTLWFGGNGIPNFTRGEQIRVVVNLTSNQTETDYVAWHWARNTYGLHRTPFTLTSSNGTNRTYERTFNIHGSHKLGVFGGYISANTHKSLWDDDPSLFSSTTAGVVYKILQ